MNFLKDDDEKIDYSLVDIAFYEELAKNLSFGAKKYGKNNWKNCDDTTRYINALERHLIEIKKGNLIDNESKLTHISHLVANAMFLHYLLKTKLD